MIIHKLSHVSAIKLQAEFIDLIGNPIDKSMPNAIIERVYLKDYGNQIWTVELYAYDKYKHLGITKQLINYLIEEKPEFDIGQYGVILDINN